MDSTWGMGFTFLRLLFERPGTNLNLDCSDGGDLEKGYFNKDRNSGTQSSYCRSSLDRFGTNFRETDVVEQTLGDEALQNRDGLFDGVVLVDPRALEEINALFAAQSSVDVIDTPTQVPGAGENNKY